MYLTIYGRDQNSSHFIIVIHNVLYSDHQAYCHSGKITPCIALHITDLELRTLYCQ